MADAWTVSDYTLYRVLRAYLASLNPASWFVMDLYTNDHVPAPGDEAGDYAVVTVDQWPGYVGAELPAPGWTNPSLTNDVASTNQPAPAVWSFPEGIGSFLLYGYFVTDGYGNLLWAEQFPAPVLTAYPGGLAVVPYLNLGILPSAGAMADVQEDEDDSGDDYLVR
jgi:hypothetical protein